MTTPSITTERLTLVPITPEDAPEMSVVLGDPTLYTYIGGAPPATAELDSRYRRWTGGSSRNGETWHNWVVRLGDRGPACGHVQATVFDEDRRAEIAWIIGTPWQGRGYASEAARALADWLEASGVTTINAHVGPGNAASACVAANAGLRPTAEIADGETVWRRA